MDGRCPDRVPCQGAHCSSSTIRRLLQKSDDRRDAPPVGVMSHRAWTQFFAHDHEVYRFLSSCVSWCAR